jgi:Protein of unknown function (DUF4242)
MTNFLVELSFRGMTRADLTALRCALREASTRLSTPRAPVRYVGSVYQLRLQTCLCLFEATTAYAVRSVVDTAQVPFSSLQEAVLLLEKGCVR